MKKALLASLLLVAAPAFAACSSSSDGGTPTSDGGTDDATTGDSGADGATDGGDVDTPSASNIKHIVIIVQENHSFDDHFGQYCTAGAGSKPTCNDGPACCEAMPATDPSGAVPINLDDTAMGAYDPSHLSTCEDAEMNGGAMDKYTNAACGDVRNVAAA
ncbi:MAG: alkaline phosphatase family protein, partial [Polyangiaceae bacterium]